MSFDSMIVSSGIWFHNVLECLSFFWVKVCNFFRLLISCHNNTVKCTFCYHDDNHLRGLWKFSENSFRCYSLENVMRNLLFWCTEIWFWSFFFVNFNSCHGENFIKFNRFLKNVVCCNDIKDWDMISVVCEDVSLIWWKVCRV